MLKFNRTNSNIDWAPWSWNPVTGCLHACPYCYARDIATRFFPGGFLPTSHEERLAMPFNTRPSAEKAPGVNNVFTCSMADLFGDWVPVEWIDQVLKVCEQTPQWNYLDIEFPVNASIGATADTNARAVDALAVFRELRTRATKPTVSFLSCEPLTEEITEPLDGIDWLIIGGRSRSSKMPAGQPEWVWVQRLLDQARTAEIKVYMKPNLTVEDQSKRLKEYPQGERYGTI